MKRLGLVLLPQLAVTMLIVFGRPWFALGLALITLVAMLTAVNVASIRAARRPSLRGGRA